MSGKRVMAIDPSINFMGVAVFEGKKPIFWRLLRPESVLKDEIQKCVDLYNKVYDLSDEYKPDLIVLEQPDHWAVAGFEARESGSIQKLVFLCGMLFTLGNVQLVLPRKWKGQLPKNVVRNRLMPLYPDIIDEKLDHNIVDALGIAHWRIHGRI